MRRRVLLPLLLFGLIAVFALILPACVAIAQARTQQLQLQRVESIAQILQRAAPAIERGDRAGLVRYLGRFHDAYGEAVLVVDSSGEVIATVGDSPSDEMRRVIASALSGLPQWHLPTVYPWSGDTAYLAEPLLVDDGAAVAAVGLAVDQTTAKSDVIAGWSLVAAAGSALFAALLTAAVLWTRWVLRPVLALDAAANALAEQRRPAQTDASGPPELRRLAESFDRMAKSMESALEQQRGLVADASHQLRNPLAAIRLRIDALHGERAATDLQDVERDLDRLEHTVERLLVLANAEHRANVELGGGPDDGREPPECLASAQRLAAPYHEPLAAEGVALETYGREARIACDPSDLEEIVDLLLDNARKYAGAGATVRVGLVPDAGTVDLVVSDSGEGLDAEELGMVGTRFWRSPAHADLRGVGLGYAIIDQLARANRGAVSVDRAPEGGLRTRVRLRAA